jgi:hypothetical protein
LVGLLVGCVMDIIRQLYIYTYISCCACIHSSHLFHLSIHPSVLGGEIKRCPFCKRIIEKTGGCDQMFCGQDAEGNGAVM